MADLQKYFIAFHDNIALRDENQTLREKRDIVLTKLRSGLAAMREDGESIPEIASEFGQGSYSMGIGNVPIDRDYDIDHGIVFDLATSDFIDPVVVKQWVFEALDGHTDRVELRRNCITVYYHQDGEPVYHVDIAVYACAEKNVGRLHLAKGKVQSNEDNKVWEQADPQALINLVKAKAAGEGGEQFRRTIRYLKRWKDVRFASSGNAAPPGIGLAVLVLNCFAAVSTFDVFANKTSYDDLACLQGVVSRILAQFTHRWIDGELQPWLAVLLPVAPYNDLLGRMTVKQMAAFKSELQDLQKALAAAANDIDEHSACDALQKKAFGDDFPVPEKSDTALKRSRSVSSSGSSA